MIKYEHATYLQAIENLEQSSKVKHGVSLPAFVVPAKHSTYVIKAEVDTVVVSTLAKPIYNNGAGIFLA